MNLHNMKLGDNFWCSEMGCNILRVPGGWLFRTADEHGEVYLSQAFVPFDMEFKKTSESAESPATDRQQLQAKIRLSLECAKGAALNNDMSTVFRFINEAYAELSAMQ